MRYFLSGLVLVALLPVTLQTSATTLEDVYDSRALKCGVTTSALNFSAPDTRNHWRGFEVELCRALALMIFGTVSEDYITFVPLTSTERIDALTTGRVHLLAAQQEWNWRLAAQYNLEMVGPYFYDGQGLLVTRSSGIRSLWNIQNKNICVVSGSAHELRLRRLLKRLRYPTQLALFDDSSAMLRGFEDGRCDAMSANVTELFSLRRTLAKPETTTIVPQLLSKRPLGFVVSAEHHEWPLLLDLFLSGLIYADELGVNSRNITRAEEEGSEDIITFLNFGANELFEPLSSDNWVKEVITTFGSYQEIFLKYFGPQSVTPFPEGVHRNWSTGGLIYGTPIY